MISMKVKYFNLIFIVYFLVDGVAGYVLPRYNNAVYIEIEKGDHFGLFDFFG